MAMDTLLESDNMRLDKAGKLAWLTFTRERYLNAMSVDCTFQINRLLEAVRDDQEVRVLVIRGHGRAFSTGLDLKEFSAGKVDMTYHQRWEAALRTIETMEQLVIVGMHGYCLGGALQLALACDIRVSTPGCRLGLPALKESLVPGLAVRRLAMYVGLGRAKRLILGGEDLSGLEALGIGLVDHVVPGEDFFAELDGVAAGYLKACSLGARMGKLLINRTLDMGYDEALEDYMGLQERAQYSPDAQRAKKAYLDKTEPEWE